MKKFTFGINLGFAVKRWPEPHTWAKIVTEDMGVNLVQFTFDLLDPWWPESHRKTLAAQIKYAAQEYGVTIHSAFAGLAYYTYNGLLNPEPAGREIMKEWWKWAIDVTREIGADTCGGPLGGLSVADGQNPAKMEQLYNEQIAYILELCDIAKQAGLRQFLIEATPLRREFPHTVEQAQKMSSDLAGAAIPVRFVLDVGHALYQPLYGPNTNTQEWLTGLGDQIGIIHLQNTDFQSDSHWGWPNERGLFDLPGFANEVKKTNLTDIPIILEVLYPFELADEQVLDHIVKSARFCLHHLA